MFAYRIALSLDIRGHLPCFAFQWLHDRIANIYIEVQAGHDPMTLLLTTHTLTTCIMHHGLIYIISHIHSFLSIRWRLMQVNSRSIVEKAGPAFP
jgi:hypothetical protein